MANGVIPVHRGHRQDVGTEIQAERLAEFDQFTEHRTALESDVPLCHIRFNRIARLYTSVTEFRYAFEAKNCDSVSNTSTKLF